MHLAVAEQDLLPRRIDLRGDAPVPRGVCAERHRVPCRNRLPLERPANRDAVDDRHDGTPIVRKFAQQGCGVGRDLHRRVVAGSTERCQGRVGEQRHDAIAGDGLGQHGIMLTDEDLHGSGIAPDVRGDVVLDPGPQVSLDGLARGGLGRQTGHKRGETAAEPTTGHGVGTSAADVDRVDRRAEEPGGALVEAEASGWNRAEKEDTAEALGRFGLPGKPLHRLPAHGVADEMESLPPERVGDRQQVAAHLPYREVPGDVPGSAVAAEVGEHEGVVLHVEEGDHRVIGPWSASQLWAAMTLVGPVPTFS